MIKLRNVEKSYKTGAGESFVLLRISTDIERGEFVTIMGPSGAGKSTLFSILGMLDGDWRGGFYLTGEPVYSRSLARRVSSRVSSPVESSNSLRSLGPSSLSPR